MSESLDLRPNPAEILASGDLAAFLAALGASAQWFLDAQAAGVDMLPTAHLKTAEEANELADNPDDIVEWADVAICLVAVAMDKRWSVDELTAAISGKNTRNARRTWARGPEGTYRHVTGD